MSRDEKPTLSPNDLTKIGYGLISHFDFVTKQALPARMQFLLRQIEASERADKRPLQV